MNATIVQDPPPTFRAVAGDVAPSPEAGPVSLRLATTVRDLPAVESAWREMRDCHGVPTPNTEPCIYTATVNALGEAARPYIAIFEDRSGPRGAIIARRSRRMVPCRLGYLVLRTPKLECLDVVYGGLITDGTEAARRAVRDHMGTLLESRRVDHVMINHLPSDHELFTDFTSFASACVRGEPTPHHRFTLADGPFEKTLQRFSRKHRYNIRRADRMLAEHCSGDLMLQCITGAPDIAAFMRAAARITEAGYQGAIGGGIGQPGVRAPVLRASAGEGLLRCYLLRAGGRAIAFQAGIVCRRVYHLQSTAFLPEFSRFSPGQVLLIRVMEHLCRDGVRTIDYGFGDAPYKRMYGDDGQQEAVIHLYGDGPRARSARLLHRGLAAAGRLGLSTAARLGLLDPIRKRWRRRLAGRGARPMEHKTAS